MHTIVNILCNSGGGSPNSKAESRDGTTPLPQGTLPAGAEAREEYMRQGGNLRSFGEFGSDPLKERLDLVTRRTQLFHAHNLSHDSVFSNTAGGDGSLLKQSIHTFLDITQRLEQLM